MSHPYGADETKGLYPGLPDQQQQQSPTAPPAAVTYYPPTGPPQQQPQQLVIQQPPVIVRQTEPVKSFVPHIILSCVVFWCCGCGCLCGLIAFILASK